MATWLDGADLGWRAGSLGLGCTCMAVVVAVWIVNDMGLCAFAEGKGGYMLVAGRGISIEVAKSYLVLQSLEKINVENH